jgi:uncharacterized repeat protein (TIGR02543 family)
VIYIANGGNGTMENSNIIIGESQNLRINTFTNTNYVFLGWATSAFGSVVYTDGQNVRNLSTTAGTTITLYAIWANFYTVTYNANGGSGTMANSIFILGESQNLRENTFTRTGYIFTGWATSSDGTVIYTDGESINDPSVAAGVTVTLYAVWHFVTVVPGSSLAAKLAWLQTNALSSVNYTIEADADEDINPTILSYSGRNNIGITLISTGGERIIGLSSNGVMFRVANGVTLTLDNNTTLQGRNDNNNNSLVYVDNGGSLIMNTGSCITGNISTSTTSSPDNGGGVFVFGGTFTMYNGKISGNTASSGAGVYVYSSGKFTMHNGEISDNTGGGVELYGNVTFTMYGGKISGNTSSSYGGGVRVNSNTIFTMSGGEISGNTAERGGGIMVWGGTFNMSGGEISGNSARSGGGVGITGDGTFTMREGKISNNTANTNGGGVCIALGTFAMNSVAGEISSNTAEQGGGVHVALYGTFTLSKGAIRGNSAFSGGGGVYVNGSFFLTEGTISRNSVSYGHGGGVYVGGSFILTQGVIYGSNETSDIRNTASGFGGTLYKQSGIVQYGSLVGTVFLKSDDLDTTDATIRIVNGNLLTE